MSKKEQNRIDYMVIEIEHTLSLEDVIDDMMIIAKNNGENILKINKNKGDGKNEEEKE